MRDVVLVLMLLGLAWFVWSMLFSPVDGAFRRDKKRK